MRQSLLLSVIFQLAAVLLFAQAGSPDNSFAGNGKKQSTVNNYGPAVVALQPEDQMIVVAGGNSVVRYTSIGTVDNNFGSGGIATLNFGSAKVNIHAMAIQSNGGIVLAGTYVAPGGAANLFVTRLTTLGQIDGSFNNIGFNTLPNYDQAGGATDGATAVAIQSDGKIVVCGEYYNPATGVDNKHGPFYLGVARFTTTGQLDNNFGSGGQVITNPGNKKTAPTGMVVTSTDKIIICGYRMHWLLDTDNSVDSVLVFQYTKDGVLDAGNFGTNGTGGIARYLSGSNYACHANAVTLQPDGKVLLAGFYLSGGTEPDFLVMRLNTNGTLDNNFAGNGRAGIGFGHADYASGIGVEPGTGAIVVGGITQPSGGYEFAVCRINPADGTLDQGFGTGGMAKIPWTSSAPMFNVANLAIQPIDGRIVVTGTAKATSALTYYFATIRLLSTGSSFAATSDSAAVTRTAAAFSTDNHSGIKLFPNPAAGELQVTGLPVGAPVTLTVTDMGGNTLIQQRTGQGNILLDISRLAPAAYVLSIAGPATRQSLPFIKAFR
jgi:uncharacterized delta-60 repeat protein